MEENKELELINPNIIIDFNVPENYKTDISKYKKINTNLPLVALAFEPLTNILKKTLQNGTTETFLAEVTIPKGAKLHKLKNGSGYLGSIAAKNGGVGGGQAAINPVNLTNLNPYLMVMTIAYVQISKKLDDIKELQEDIYDFLVQKERSELKGDLAFLQDIYNNYKFNINNEQYKKSNHIKALDIRQTAERKIDFYKEQIDKLINKKEFLYMNKNVDKKLEKIQSNFIDYQIAVYIYAFSSFVEVMLLENFSSEYLNEVVKKIEQHSLDYRILYSKSFSMTEKYVNSSVEENILKSISGVNKVAGKGIEKIPFINKLKIDEKLIEVGNTLDSIGDKRTERKLSILTEKASTFVAPFVENIKLIDDVNNKTLKILIEKDEINYKIIE